MTKKNQIDKNFISEIDKDLTAFDRSHPLTESQLAEINRNQRVAYLRDHPATEATATRLWE